MTGSFESLPLPNDPTLAAWASALNDAGHWAWLMDDRWRYVWLTDELRLSFGDTGDWQGHLIGSHYFSEQAVRFPLANVHGLVATRDLLPSTVLGRGSLCAREHAGRS